MANNARNVPGGTGTKIKDEDINPLTLGKLENFYETNKKTLSTAAPVILVVVGVFFAYTKLYKGPTEEKAATALSFAQRYFEADSLNLAMAGDGKNLGFTKIATKYSGTAAGNLAHYYEGMCYLHMGDFANAIKSLKAFDGKGTMVGALAYGALGDAYMETGDNAKAIENFKKASENKNDNLVTPLYLYRLGLAYEASGKAPDAVAAFKRVRDEFPRSLQARDMDKELARLGELN